MRRKTKKSEQKKTKPKKRFKKPKREVLDSLKPNKNPKVRRELMDADYLHKLEEKDLNYYAKFMGEWAGAAIKKDKKTGRVAKGHLHTRKDQAKELYDSNNRRNNDILGVSRANSLLSHIEGLVNANDTENGEITRIYDSSLVQTAIASAIDEKVRLTELSKKTVKEMTDEEKDEMYISKREFLKMFKNKIHMPKEMIDFYINLYNLKEKDLE